MSMQPNVSKLRDELGFERPRREPFQDATLDFRVIELFIRRHLKLLAIGPLLGLVLGFVVSGFLPHNYSATAEVQYGPVRGNGADQRTTLDAGQTENAIEGQVAIVQSGDLVTKAVIDNGFARDPDVRAVFAGKATAEGPAPLRGVANAVVDPEVAQISAAIFKALKVDRIGKSLVITITVVSRNATVSARVANAIAGTYVRSQVEANAALARSSADWLREQVDQLHAKAEAKDREVEAFKQQHQLLGSDGHDASQQQLAELNSNVVQAQAEVDRLNIRQQRIDEIKSSGDPVLGAIQDIADPDLTALLTKRDATVQRFEHLRYKLGDGHKLVQALQQQLNEQHGEIHDALGRQADASASQLEQARGRLQTARANLAQAVSTNQSAEGNSAKLRDLIGESDALHRTYQSSFDRLQQALQDQSYPVSDARQVQVAEPPTESISTNQTKAMAVGAGLLFSFAILAGFILDLLHGGMRTGRDVRNGLNLPLVGLVPHVAGGQEAQKGPDGPFGPDAGQRLLIAGDPGCAVAEAPSGKVAAQVRAIKSRIDTIIDTMQDGATAGVGRVIGIVSAHAREGKSVLATNLALAYASKDKRVAVIDVRNSSPGGQHAVTLEELSHRVIQHSRDNLYSVALDSQEEIDQLPTLIKALAAELDVVIVVFPELTTHGHATDNARLVDCFVAVAQWGRTPARVLKSAFDAHPAVVEGCSGVVLCDADMQRIALYDPTGGRL